MTPPGSNDLVWIRRKSLRIRPGVAETPIRRGRRILAAATVIACTLTAPAAEWVPRMLLLDAALVGTDVVAVGERGTIVRSGDEGMTWTRSESRTFATLTAVSFAPDSAARIGWAVGHDALILGTTDAGQTWAVSFQGPNLQDSFLDVLALDATNAIAIGAYGLCLVTADAGQTWTRRELSREDVHCNRITRGPTGTLYIAGERGTLLRSKDRGANWTAIPAPYEGSFYGVLPLGPTLLLAHGLRGHAYQSSNDGETWTLVPTPATALYAAAVRLQNGDILLAGNAPTLAQSVDQGRTFTASPNAAGALADLLQLPSGRVLAVGESGVTIFPLRP